jgi:acetyl-CoA carboxylase biotin carboxyl carrier protein
MFSFEEIKELAKIVKENDLGEIEIKSANGDSIAIKAKRVPPQPPAIPPAPMVAAQNIAAPLNVAANEPVAETKAEKSGKEVKSPIVGTFYSAADPNSEAFVKVGDSVKKGDVICIIEAMKIMNEVTAEFDGVVKEILVSNGDAVEYDQTIMIFE